MKINSYLRNKDLNQTHIFISEKISSCASKQIRQTIFFSFLPYDDRRHPESGEKETFFSEEKALGLEKRTTIEDPSKGAQDGQDLWISGRRDLCKIFGSPQREPFPSSHNVCTSPFLTFRPPAIVRALLFSWPDATVAL